MSTEKADEETGVKGMFGFEAKSKVAGGFKELAKLLTTALFPLLVMLLSVLVAPLVGVKGWMDPVKLAWPDLTVWPALFAQGVLMGAWHYYNMRYVRNSSTTVRQLKDEISISIWMGFALVAVGAYMLGTGKVYLWYVIPMVFAFLDAKQSPDEAINNAAQKPLVESMGRS